MDRRPFGLSAIVCTQSAPRAIRAIHELECGMVKINAPADPAKDSGLGMGHGVEFLRELTFRKSVHWRAQLEG